MSCPSDTDALLIYYLCTGNSARSQMAEHLTLHRAPQGAVRVSSAGTDPQGVHPLTVKVMKEIGIDMTQASSDRLNPELLTNSDLVITLCGDARDRCPFLPPEVSLRHWPLADPAADPAAPEAFRRARDEIDGYVTSLLAELNLQ